MVQQIRHGEQQYICVVPVESITGNQEEEIMTFGVSADEAKHQAEELLANNYGCKRWRRAPAIMRLPKGHQQS
jgi:alpha-D-ribose 1-methylphosphonate 5-triphosphate synthase subunit PhnL